MAQIVKSFDGEYFFLSNFYPASVQLDGEVYPTVEHAFQAAKTFDQTERGRIRTAQSPGQAKRLGRKVKLRNDWEEVKVGIMLELLMDKFKDESLKGALLGTGDAELIEGNTWHDKYWGVCHCSRCGKGANMLGNLLAQVRVKLGTEDRE